MITNLFTSPFVFYPLCFTTHNNRENSYNNVTHVQLSGLKEKKKKKNMCRILSWKKGDKKKNAKEKSNVKIMSSHHIRPFTKNQLRRLTTNESW